MLGNQTHKDVLENLGTDGKIILKWVLKKSVGGSGLA